MTHRKYSNKRPLSVWNFYFYKYRSEGGILSWIVRKMWCTEILLIISAKQMNNNCAPSFNIIFFVLINHMLGQTLWKILNNVLVLYYTLCNFYNILIFFILQKYFNRAVYLLNPFHATGLFLYPLKTSEKLWFSDIFRVYRKRPMAWNGLMPVTIFSGKSSIIVAW